MLVNRQIKEAHRHLDGLCTKIAENDGESGLGQKPEQRDVTILRSLLGVGWTVLATLLAEASEPLRRRDYHAWRTLTVLPGHQAQRQVLHGQHAPGAAICGRVAPFITGRA